MKTQRYLTNIEVLTIGATNAQNINAFAERARKGGSNTLKWFADELLDVWEHDEFETDYCQVFVNGEASDTLSFNDGRVIEASWQAHADAQFSSDYDGIVELYLWRAAWDYALRVTYGPKPE